jgi:hypothetical protein
MQTIEVAIGTAAAGFVIKIFLDVMAEHGARKAIAAALAGELGAYLRLMQPVKTFESLRELTRSPHAHRVAALRGAFSLLPSGHPVFDRIADKIGTLSPDAARRVSEAYNIITSSRLLLASLSSEAFLQASDELQKTKITVMTNMVEPEIEGIGHTIRLLENLSSQSFLCFLAQRVW